jgi:hypothetical protein
MSAARFFIPSLPGQPSDASVTMYGGHIPSAPPKNGVPDTESDAHLYFYLVRNKHIAETERTLLWSVPTAPSCLVQSFRQCIGDHGRVVIGAQN